MTTDWSQTELEAGHASRLVNSVLRWLPSALIMVGENNQILHINEKARTILQLEATESRYKSILDLPYYLNELKHLFLEEDDFEVTRAEVQIQLPKKNEKSVLGYTVRRETIPELGSVVTLVFSDITQVLKENSAKEAMKQEVFQAKKMKAMGSVIANVAEELNNPLIAMSMTHNLLDKTLDSLAEGKPIPKQKAIQLIREHNQRFGAINIKANAIVKILLQYARPERMETVGVEWDPFVGKLIEHWRLTLFNREDILLRFDNNATDAWVNVDSQKMESVLYSLVQNAVEATRPDDTIEIVVRTSTRALEDNPSKMLVVTEVEDNGIGIAPHIWEQMFDPFFTTKGNQSAGLGLSNTYKILEHHNGSIAVASTAGKGSCFSFTLPVDEVDLDLDNLTL